ncbi:AMP-binding protein [Tomitella gaofuii]|uniref:AMP-binding protein n=1 Tax=Tomitella gaofuii TaxID=2760083 RepID=UPI0015FB01E0|nr:AMP-binding protein [Tomitella gaofuii]
MTGTTIRGASTMTRETTTTPSDTQAPPGRHRAPAGRNFAPVSIETVQRPDGARLVRSTVPLAPHEASIVRAFRAGARVHPDRTLIAERSPDGTGWRTTTWGQMAEQADALAAGLVARGVADRPVMILSEPSTAHVAVMLAAMTVGAPVVPASVAYSLQSDDHAKLRALVGTACPGTVFAQDARYARALEAVTAERLVVLGDAGDAAGTAGAGDTAGAGNTTDTTDAAVTLAALAADADAGSRARAEELFAGVGPDTIAKIMFTSGSTGSPKGVINTQGMLTANQQQMRQVWPFLADEPPVLLDWLPWSHTFGGNHNLHMVLVNGGTLWIDDGRPAPGMIERTVRNLQDVSPTVYFNVPAGYGVLVPILERDDAAARRFFASLRLGFCAAAALPQGLLERIRALAHRHGSTMEMTTSWGLTERLRQPRRRTSPSSAAPPSGCRCRAWNWSSTPWAPRRSCACAGPTSRPGSTAAPTSPRPYSTGTGSCAPATRSASSTPTTRPGGWRSTDGSPRTSSWTPAPSSRWARSARRSSPPRAGWCKTR